MIFSIVPLLVVSEPTPKLLLKINVPSPPVVFFTILIEPLVGGGGVYVLLKVHEVVFPATTFIAVIKLPLSQLAPAKLQSLGMVS